MTDAARLPDELEFELQAIALIFNDHQREFDRRAYEIVGRQIEGATARLAELIGKSVDWVEDRAKAHKLALDLDEEFGKASERARNMLPENYIVAVARKYSPTAEPNKLDLGEAFEKLCDFTKAQPDGKPWNIEAVRASLPHSSRDDDYGKVIERLAKSLPLLMKPTLLGISERKQKIALQIASALREVAGLIEQFRKADG